MMKLSAQELEILQSLADTNDGILKPEMVVEAARPIESPLHHRFTWDDSQAAAQWRLEEARRVIQVSVVYLHQEPRTPMRVFCSLPSDRVRGGGYRRTIEVLRSNHARAELVQDALAELDRWCTRHQHLTELHSLIGTIRRAMKSTKSKLGESLVAS
jgi:hypothetical protein